MLSELQQWPDDWTQLGPLFQSAINNAQSPQRQNVAPITVFTGGPASPPISTLIHSADAVPQTLTKVQGEKTLNTAALVTEMEELHPVINQAVQKQRQRMRVAREKGELPKFSEGDFVLVFMDELQEGEKLCLRWWGPRMVTKSLSDYVFNFEDLRNGSLSCIHWVRLKCYAEKAFDTQAIFSHVLALETGISVLRLRAWCTTKGNFMCFCVGRALPIAMKTNYFLSSLFPGAQVVAAN